MYPSPSWFKDLSKLSLYSPGYLGDDMLADSSTPICSKPSLGSVVSSSGNCGIGFVVTGGAVGAEEYVIKTKRFSEFFSTI